MRIVSGIARGKKLTTPNGNSTRPTIDRVKEAVFSSLQFDIEGRRILDLFAGSGQLGLEALSRGAASCDFVDSDFASIEVVKSNIENCGFEETSFVNFCDSFSYLEKTDKTFDIAFLDPPYSKNLIDKAMPMLVNKMSEYGIIVCEHGANDALEECYGSYKKKKTKRYGTVYVTFYRKSED